MDLAKLQRNGDLLSRGDPLRTILFDQTKLGDRWRPEECFATGRQEVARLLADLDRVGVPVRGGRVPVRGGRALDFGCGAGTLTVTFAAGAAILGLLLLTNPDVLLARHHLTFRAAGLYAVEGVMAVALLAAGWVLERCGAPSPVLAP